MSGTRSDWLLVAAGPPPPLLAAALTAARRDGQEPQVETVAGDVLAGLLEAARKVSRGEVRLVLALTPEPLIGCCLANKVAGVRAAATDTLEEAMHALRSLGANYLLADPRAKTWFELRQLLRWCAAASGRCPDKLAAVVGELERHAHR